MLRHSPRAPWSRQVNHHPVPSRWLAHPGSGPGASGGSGSRFQNAALGTLSPVIMANANAAGARGTHSAHDGCCTPAIAKSREGAPGYFLPLPRSTSNRGRWLGPTQTLVLVAHVREKPAEARRSPLTLQLPSAMTPAWLGGSSAGFRLTPTIATESASPTGLHRDVPGKRPPFATPRPGAPRREKPEGRCDLGRVTSAPPLPSGSHACEDSAGE